MLPSTASVEPIHSLGAPFTRSDSIASSLNSSHSGVSLSRRPRTRTRSLVPSRRAKSSTRSASSKYESDAGESFLDLDDAPPVPKLLHDEPEEMRSDQREVRRARRRSRTIGPEGRSFEDRGLRPDMPNMARSWSALDIRDPPEQSRGRQAKSDTGSVTAPKSRLRGLSLPRQAFRQNAHSDSSSQPSPQTPHGFGDGPAVRVAGPTRTNLRDSVLTQISATSSSVYPASTSAGSRTESSMPYTEDDADADLSYPDIVSPEHSNFDPDDVSYRLRLLLNNSYFLPPAHAKPTPMALSSHPQDAAQKSKPATSGFLDFFRIGKAKSKPTSPAPGSPPPVDSNGPILRTTSDSPSASGLLLRVQTQPLAPPPVVTPPCPPPTSRVVVLRERMDDLASAAKEAEKEIRHKADGRKPKTPTAGRDRFVDDVIDPTDAVDLPPPSADALFAVQASALFGLGPQDSVGAAVLAERLVPNSPGIWSISSEEEVWRKELLREAVSHSLGNTPESSFSSSDGRQAALSPPPQSEATFPTPAILEAQKRVGQRIVEDFSIRTASSEPSPPVSPVEPLTIQIPPAASNYGGTSFVEKSPKASEHPLLTALEPPVRAETPAHMHIPLSPAPRKQLVNPVYSLSEPDLSDTLSKAKEPSPGSSEATFHTVRKASSTPRMSSSDEARRAVSALSPPPIPEHPEIHRGLSPAPRNLEGMPSFTTSRTESDSRYSDDSMSFRTPMDTDVEVSGARPSMTISIPSGRPSISVSEYSAPSPTASAFRDAVFGSCRPPSSLSRRSATSILEPMQSEVSRPPPVTPRNVAMSPPPRLSSSVSPTVLPPPPRPPAIRPTYRPSISTNDSQSPGAHSGPSVALSSPSSDAAPVQDVSVQISISDSSVLSSPSAPLAARRGQNSPLSLHIPHQYGMPSIHSAPAPSSPTDFFDRIQSTIANAMDDLETSDESSDEELSLEGAEHARSRYNHPPPPRSPQTEPEPVETAAVFVEPRTQAISNRASSSSSRPSIMRLGNHSTPQLSPAPSFVTAEPMPQYTFDRKKPIGNVADMTRRSFTSVRSLKSVKKGKGIMNISSAPKSPLLPIGPVPSSPINPYAMGTGVSSSSVGSSKDARRPATAPSEGARRAQRESIQKFDGMLLQHLAAERDRIRQITSNISNSNSAASSPVQGYPSAHPFANAPPAPSTSSSARARSRSRSRPRAKTSG
ncbi:hypothetical protein PYCCODRAFT_1474502 [Trametes coccinea BRFM310]|uniref:Uncharacterized protein n=1 Tax=Trametes coccinea (strain BRFM310) TaxID=1353009 RepID=A0A1Y2IYW3_TRAC3|nr:hypothetical protein PYCCODRAFT_1474502 [Trametes coccinea BRFM310]